jgi:hypothetical protein
MKKFLSVFIFLISLGFVFWSCSDDSTSPEGNLTCEITTPIGSTGFFAGETITVVANANDTDGSITEVRFLMDENGISSDQEFPYTANIFTSQLAVGTHLITAVAENDRGKEVETSVFIGIKPNTPTNLIINQLNVYTFSLTWSDNSEGEDGFLIERKIDTGNFIEIATVTENTYTDSTVSKKGFGTVYYQVKAFKEIYYSNYATAYSIVGFPAPSNIVATPTSVTQATLSWKDNSDGEEKFEIERKLSNESVFSKVAELSGDSLAMKSWDDSYSDPFLYYDYRIRAVKGNNSSPYDTLRSYQPFPKPGNFNVTQQSIKEANLSWTDNSIGEDKFVIERKLNTDSEYTIIGEVNGSDTSSKSWVDNTVIPKLTYDYRINSVSSNFTTEYSLFHYVNIFSEPSNFYLTQFEYTKIKLNWNDNHIGEDGFRIDKKVNDGSWVLDYCVLSENITEWIDTDVAYYSEYFYRIKSYSSNIYTDYSEIKSMYFEPTFSITFGGTEDEIAYSILQTVDGGYALAGITGSYGAGDRDFWLLKLDTEGTLEWDKTYGTGLYERSESLVATNDSYLLTGCQLIYKDSIYDYDALVVKTDLNGNEVWRNNYGDPLTSDYSTSIIKTQDENFVITGYTKSEAGDWNFWVFKINNAGNKIWDHNYGTIYLDHGHSVVETQDGGFLVVGDAGQDMLVIKIDSNGNQEWLQTYDSYNYDVGYEVIKDKDNNYLIAGRKGKEDSTTDIWLLKIDFSGSIIFDKVFGEGEGYSIDNTVDGGCILTGHTPQYDIILIKVDNLGNEEWHKTYGGVSAEKGLSVKQTKGTGYIFTGYTSSFGAGSSDVWVIKTDPLGNVEGLKK